MLKRLQHLNPFFLFSKRKRGNMTESQVEVPVGDSYATGKPLPPREEWVPRIFHRQGMFYTIELPADDDLEEHARQNPLTVKITDIEGNQLWPVLPEVRRDN